MRNCRCQFTSFPAAAAAAVATTMATRRNTNTRFECVQHVSTATQPTSRTAERGLCFFRERTWWVKIRRRPPRAHTATIVVAIAAATTTTTTATTSQVTVAVVIADDKSGQLTSGGSDSSLPRVSTPSAPSVGFLDGKIQQHIYADLAARIRSSTILAVATATAAAAAITLRCHDSIHVTADPACHADACAFSFGGSPRRRRRSIRIRILIIICVGGNRTLGGHCTCRSKGDRGIEQCCGAVGLNLLGGFLEQILHAGGTAGVDSVVGLQAIQDSEVAYARPRTHARAQHVRLGHYDGRVVWSVEPVLKRSGDDTQKDQ